MDKAHVLALDMDETLCSLISPVINQCVKLFPDRTFKLPKFGRYNSWFDDNFRSEDEWALAREHFFKDEFYLTLPPVLSANHSPGLERFSEVCWSKFDKIYVVTAREGFMQNPAEVSQEWLRRNKFKDADRIEYIVVNHSQSKLSVVSEPTLFVDDSVGLGNEVCSSRDHSMIMVNHPWNDGFVRTNNCTIATSRRLIETLAYVADNL